jgi:ferredoxin
VEVCPVDAFREGKNVLVIDPDDCIECRLAFQNVLFTRSTPATKCRRTSTLTSISTPALPSGWPVITRRRPLAAGDESATVKIKGHLLLEHGRLQLVPARRLLAEGGDAIMMGTRGVRALGNLAL